MEFYEGRINYSKINKIFDEIQNQKYSEKEAITIIINIELASYYVSKERTNYHTPKDETLLYLTQFITINGSPNYEILYVLFTDIVLKEKKETVMNIII